MVGQPWRNLGPSTTGGVQSVPAAAEREEFARAEKVEGRVETE